MIHRPGVIAMILLPALTGCALGPPTKVNPGANFTTTCFAQRFGDMSACESQAREKCENPPVSTQVTSQKTGNSYTYSIFYRCP